MRTPSYFRAARPRQRPSSMNTMRGVASGARQSPSRRGGSTPGGSLLRATRTGDHQRRGGDSNSRYANQTHKPCAPKPDPVGRPEWFTLAFFHRARGTEPGAAGGWTHCRLLVGREATTQPAGTPTQRGSRLRSNTVTRASASRSSQRSPRRRSDRSGWRITTREFGSRVGQRAPSLRRRVRVGALRWLCSEPRWR